MHIRPPPKPVEDYTNAFLVSFGVVLFMVLWLIAAVAGFVWVLVTGYAVNRVIRFIETRKGD